MLGRIVLQGFESHLHFGLLGFGVECVRVLLLVESCGLLGLLWHAENGSIEVALLLLEGYTAG